MRKTIDPIMRHFPIWIALAALGMACWGPVERVYASYINKPGGAGAAFYQTIEDAGVAVTQRPVFNFVSSPVVAVADNAGDNRTDITISTGPGGGNVTTSATLTAGLPVIGNGTTDVDIGTRSGNTTLYMSGAGGFTNGNCAEFDADGNIVDSGAACGGSAVAAYNPIAPNPVTVNLDAVATTSLLLDSVAGKFIAVGCQVLNGPVSGTVVANLQWAVDGEATEIRLLYNGTSWVGSSKNWAVKVEGTGSTVGDNISWIFVTDYETSLSVSIDVTSTTGATGDQLLCSVERALRL